MRAAADRPFRPGRYQPPIRPSTLISPMRAPPDAGSGRQLSRPTRTGLGLPAGPVARG